MNCKEVSIQVCEFLLERAKLVANGGNVFRRTFGNGINQALNSKFKLASFLLHRSLLASCALLQTLKLGVIFLDECFDQFRLHETITQSVQHALLNLRRRDRQFVRTRR